MGHTTLTSLLTVYYKWQPQLLLCYRPTEQDGWHNRCFFLDEKYNSLTPYNHRIILKNEVVIEFDEDEKARNLELAREVIKRIKKDGLNYSLHYSGNKSYHVHLFIDLGNATNIPLLKRVFMKHYTQGLILPDLQLCSDGHLIRAEFGVNEKTGKKKELIENSRGYPLQNYVPKVIWDKYKIEIEKSFTRTILRDTKELLDTPVLKTLLDTLKMKEELKDGRERVLFLLIHLLRSKYSEEELRSFLVDWYSYSGGNKLSDKDINRQITYQLKKNYTISEKYVNNLAEELGICTKTGIVKKG